jgi:flagellar secretion chaperone FliS
VDQPLAYRYRDVAIQTANPLQLIVLLYDGAIQALQEAQRCAEQKEIARRANATNRALAIISELQACLNFKEGGGIAVSLDRLYTYMKQRIFQASVEQAAGPLAEVAGLLEDLRSAWNELVARARELETVPLVPQDQQSGVLRGNYDAQVASLNISG